MKKEQKPQPKRFIIRKYVMATSAREALKKDKTAPVDDVWIDDKWIEENKGMGFKV